MLYYFKKGKNATEMQKKKNPKRICAVCGEGAVTDRMCQKWFAKFCAGEFLLDDAPWMGRLVEVDRDQTETLIEIDQCYTTWEITDILKISKLMKLLMKMKNMSFFLRKKTCKLFWPTQYL